MPLTNNMEITDGNHMTISDRFCEAGIPYYRGQDIHDFFIENSSPICIDTESYESPYMRRSHLKKGDVLLSIVGTIGGVSLVYSDNKATCSCKIAILRPKSASKGGELFATFLHSKYGQFQIQRLTRGAVQMGLLLEDMDQILVPNFTKQFSQQIKNYVHRARNIQDAALKNYADAENLLLEKLGLQDWQPAQETTTTKKFSDFKVSGRFDAEYYQPKYDEIKEKIREYPNGLVSVEKILRKAIITTAPSPCKYIELADIGMSGEILGHTEDDFCNLPSRARQKVMMGDVIVSSVEGSLPSCAIIMPEYHDALCSTGFHVLKSNEINAETLLLLCKSYPIQQLFKQGCSGTILTAISAETIKGIKLPIIRREVQQELAAKVQQSFALRKESKRLLELAKRAVEVAIEQGEDVAMKLLENEK